ncbi:MAG: hypothetical protein R3B13_33085 [Polyangiaceae bacterium]
MNTPRFDPTHAVKFNLSVGQIDLDGARVLVPPEALLQLCQAAGVESVRDFGRSIGTEVGRRLASRLGERLAGVSIDGVVDHFGGDLALLGLGDLGVERWGRALVFTLSGSPLGGQGDELVAAILEGALQRGAGRDARVLCLGRADELARFVVVSANTSDKVRSWLGEGAGFRDVIVRLQGDA